MAKNGGKTAYVALARKMLTVIRHLLVNGEKYVEEGFEKLARLKNFLRLYRLTRLMMEKLHRLHSAFSVILNLQVLLLQ